MPYEAGGLGSLTFAAAVLVVVLWSALWLLRRMRPNGGAALSGDCRIMRSLTLGPRERLVVVSVGTKQLVLGVSGAAVSLLCELNPPLPASTPALSGFGAAMRQASQRWRGA